MVVQEQLRNVGITAEIEPEENAIYIDRFFSGDFDIAVMGAAGAADIIFRREIAAAADPEQRRAELVAEYADKLLDPYVAAERGLVDDVVDPADTRRVLIRALAMLRTKRDDRPSRKHGNIPL